MKLQPILDDIQNGLNILQQKVNIIRTLDTGKFYEVDVQITRKEAAEFIGRSARPFRTESSSYGEYSARKPFPFHVCTMDAIGNENKRLTEK